MSFSEDILKKSIFITPYNFSLSMLSQKCIKQLKVFGKVRYFTPINSSQFFRIKVKKLLVYLCKDVGSNHGYARLQEL